MAEVVLFALDFQREREALSLCELLATRCFADATRSDFQGLALALRLIVPLVFCMNPSLANRIFASGDDAQIVRDCMWALSWVLTCFVHDIDDLGILFLVWDRFFAVNHSAFPLDLAAALVCHLGDQHLFFTEDDDSWSGFFSKLSKLPPKATKHDWLLITTQAYDLFQRYPPGKLA